MNICDSGISLNELEDIIKDIKMFSPISKMPASTGMHMIKILCSLSFNNIEINKSTYRAGKAVSSIKDEYTYCVLPVSPKVSNVFSTSGPEKPKDRSNILA